MMADIDAKAKELAKHLQESADGLPECPASRNYREAAALILSQAETIAELRKALAWFIDDIDGTHTVMLDFDANITRSRAALARAAKDGQ